MIASISGDLGLRDIFTKHSAAEEIAAKETEENLVPSNKETCQRTLGQSDSPHAPLHVPY